MIGNGRTISCFLVGVSDAIMIYILNSLASRRARAGYDHDQGMSITAVTTRDFVSVTGNCLYRR